MFGTKSVVSLILGSLLLALSGCAGTPAPVGAPATPAAPAAPSTPAPAAPTAKVDYCPQKGVKEMTGAGATFPFPLLSVMIDDYYKLCGVQANYQSIGSGGGIRQVQAWTVDFGASEGIMNAEQEGQATGGKVLHIPFTGGAVAMVYNLPGVPHATMKLTPEVIADIYLKKITNWSDEKLKAINPGVALPNLPIAVVHRSDGSGTTFVYTHYLSQVSEEWKTNIGFGTSVKWVGDIGGPGNEGVAQQVRQIPGAIGYVERAYALQTGMSWAQVKNVSGNYIQPTQEAAALASDIPNLPKDMRVMYTNTAHPQGYPISGFAWLLVYENQRDDAKADAVARLAYWMLTDGQKHHDPLQYVPMKGEAQAKAICLIGEIKYANGQAVLPELTCK